MAEAEKPRTRLIKTAARLLQQQGYHATGLNQILEESAAPRGSLYFYFPGGKEELASAALRVSRDYVATALRQVLAAHPDLGEGLRAYLRLAARVLARSGYRDGCPVATVTLETAATSDTLQVAARDAFGEWQLLLEERLRRAGWSPAAAVPRAILILAAIEGALMLSRARRDTVPLETIGEQLAALARPPHAADATDAGPDGG